MKTACAAVLTLMLAASTVTGQEAPAKPEPKAPFTFTGTGDTIDDYKFSIVVNQKVDQSTARGTVEAFLGFVDNRDATQQAIQAVNEKTMSLVAKAVAPWEERLLAEEAREALAKARKEEAERMRNNDKKTAASVITAETAQDDGSVLVECAQQVTINVLDKTGKPNPTEENQGYRFSCVKGDDGKWRISWAQVSEVYRDADGKEFSRKWKWRWGPGLLASAMSVTLIKLDSAAEPSQDTPENAALSIFRSLHVAEKGFKMNSAAAMYGELLRVVEPLATSKFWESAKAGGTAWADEVKKMSKAATKVAGTEPSTEGKNGSKVVKFKKSETWRAEVQAEVRELDGKWVIVEAGVWENVGGIDKGPQYRVIANIYKLPSP